MKVLKCDVCDVLVPGPLLRCPAHINWRKKRRNIKLSPEFVKKIAALDPEDRSGCVKVMAAQLDVTVGAIYFHLKLHHNFKKVGKYLIYAGIVKVPIL
jgi:hypothetical protein